MILIHAYLTIEPARRAEFLRLMGELAQASRAEAGCTGFTCYEDVTAPESLVILGEWSDQAILLATPLVKLTVAPSAPERGEGLGVRGNLPTPLLPS